MARRSLTRIRGWRTIDTLDGHTRGTRLLESDDVSGLFFEAPPGALARILISLVGVYQRSSWRQRLGPRCRFIPSCSEYSVRALRKYGAIKGSLLTARRLRRCKPQYVGPYVDFP
jgi:uncharacterized protein